MNYINCQNKLPPEVLRKTIIFWCENSFQHINSLLSAFKGSGAVLQNDFKEELLEIEKIFKSIFSEYSSNKTALPSHPVILFKTNTRFIKLLERIKFEAASGYPLLGQSVYHYIFEQNYINAIFGVNIPQNQPLITFKFAPFYTNNCIFNQMYFWSIIGAMHPSLLLDSQEFNNAINGYTREYLRDTVNGFNKICYRLSDMNRPGNKKELSEIFENFRQQNLDFLFFLQSAIKLSPKIYSATTSPQLPKTFYGKVEHMIKEHNLVRELCDSISEMF